MSELWTPRATEAIALAEQLWPVPAVTAAGLA
jgi:hypothetical protein